MKEVLFLIIGLFLGISIIFVKKPINRLIEKVKKFICIFKETMIIISETTNKVNESTDEHIIVEDIDKQNSGYTYTGNKKNSRNNIINIDLEYVKKYFCTNKQLNLRKNKAYRLTRIDTIIRVKINDDTYYFTSFNYTAILFGVSGSYLEGKFSNNVQLCTSDGIEVKFDEVLKDDIDYHDINSYKPVINKYTNKVKVKDVLQDISEYKKKEEYYQNQENLEEEWKWIYKYPEGGKGISIERYGKDVYISNYGRYKIGDNIFEHYKFGQSNTPHWVYNSFIGKIPSGYLLCHKDGNKNNNAINNLVLMTKSEQSAIQLKRNKKNGKSWGIKGGNNAGKIYINKDNVRKLVKKEEIDYYLNEGWKLGTGLTK